MADKLGRVEASAWTNVKGEQVPRWRLVFWLDDPETGRRVRKIVTAGVSQNGERIPFESEQDAKHWLESIRADYRNGHSIERCIAPYLRGRLPANMVLARWEDYLEDRKRRRNRKPISDKRLAELGGYVRRGYLEKWADATIYDVNAESMDAWVDWMMQCWPNHEPKTRHHIVNDFLGFLRWLVKVRALDSVPPKPDLPAVRAKRKPVPSPEDLARYLDAIPEHIRGFWLACAYDGLRISEAERANVRDYNWRTHVLRVVDSKTETGVRSFEVDWEVAEWLEKHVPAAARMQARAPLFRNPNGHSEGRWTGGSRRRVHERAQAASGVYFEPNHVGRHAAASHMLQRSRESVGAHDIDAVRKKLGHRDRRTTETYVDAEVIEVAHVTRLRPAAKGEEETG